jgi:hypothetical protein
VVKGGGAIADQVPHVAKAAVDHVEGAAGDVAHPLVVRRRADPEDLDVARGEADDEEHGVAHDAEGGEHLDGEEVGRDVGAVRRESGGEPPGSACATAKGNVPSEAFTQSLEVLNTIYEEDFLGFSYRFRPGRSQHDALDAVSAGLHRKKVSWVLDADIRGFFDAIDHEWLEKFVAHRIADPRIQRLIAKWLRAGVLEVGSPQGATVSPLLANIYLHYAFDLWVEWWRRRHASGEVFVVRYADDIIIGFHRRADARRFQEELRHRLTKFGLVLHPEKTRLIAFGRFAVDTLERWGQGKPETFDFLGFTHMCGRAKNGRFKVDRRYAFTRSSPGTSPRGGAEHHLKKMVAAPW